MESDHKPLEMIARKPLNAAPKRLQRMLLRLQKYDISIVCKKGKEMYLADTLSRAYLPEIPEHEDDIEILMFREEVEAIDMVKELPISEEKKVEIRQEKLSDQNYRL